jgi:autotransporter-associated beta strand protein
MKPQLLQSPSLRLITLGLALLWPSALHAAPITPVAWKQSNASNTARTAANLGNGTGMDVAQTLLYNHDGSLPGEPTSANNSQWNCVSAGFGQAVLDQRRVWIVVDLGAVYDLSTLRVWNFNWDDSPGSPTTSLNNRGISQFDVYVRNAAADTDDGTVGGTPINTSTVGGSMATAPVFNLGTANLWQEVLSNQALAQAANDDTHAATSYNLTGNTGRFLAIVVDAGYGGVNASLGKVRIEGTVPPPTGGWAINGGGSFNTPGNWSDNTVPTNNAIFGDILTAPNAPALVTLDSPASLNQVTFLNANTYSLDGPSTLTLTGGATLNASPALGTHLITAQVAGSNGVTKTGPGIVALVNPNNSYTGNTTVTEGILAATDLGAINQASGVVDVALGAAFALAGDGAGNGANGTLTEVIQGAGNLLVDRSLTTEVITLGSANPSLTGQVVVSGGQLKPGNVGALGDTTGTTLVTGGDDFDTSALWLDGITITGETLGLNARKESAAAAPHLISTGTSGWAGPIQGNTGGPNYNIQSQSGLLTLSGTIDAPNGTPANDPAIPVNGDRVFNFTGDGDVRIEGQITDVTGPGDGGNIALTKVGLGTLTIATVPTFTLGEGYHQGRTVIDGGTLAVQESGTNDGELFSRTIEVATGAIFDISSFTEYELQLIESGLGQVLSGAGTVDLGGTGSELILFPDSTISPGDRNGQNVLVGTNSTGTLTIDGDVSDSGGSTFLMEIGGDATNDRVNISGTASLSATINVTGIPTVPITNGTVFTLISAAGGFTNSGIIFGPLPSPNLTTSITATEVRLIWNDPTAPIATFSPNAVTEVPLTTDLVATFSEQVLIGTGDILIINVTDNFIEQTIPVDDNLQVGLSPSGLVLTINPLLDLQANKQYAIQIAPTAITDISGNNFAGIVDPDVSTWAFATDSIGPIAQSFSPAGASNATRNTRLLLQLNEAAQLGTGTFTIHKASDNSVVETIDVSTLGAVEFIGNKVSVVRSVTLAANTAYYVNASAGVLLDIYGNPSPAISGTSTWAFTTAALQPIVVEDFTNLGDPLNGTGADTFASGITSAGGSATWVASDSFRENGAVNVASNTAAYLNLGSYINATKGTAAGKFKLVMTISETTGSWLSLGFAAENAPNTAKNFTDVGTGTATTTGVGTIVYRRQAGDSTSGEFDMWGGNLTANAVDGPEPNSGFRRLTVELDLTPAGGYNGTSNHGTVTWFDSVLGQLGTFTYTGTRNFGSILITQATNSSGTINALALYQEGLPANTYSTWINSFAFTGFVNPNLTATGDPDNDGLPNAVENLLGTSPEVFNQGLTSVSASGGNLVFQHTLSTTPASDLAGAYEWSTNLVNWNADGAPAGGTTVTFSNPPVVITPGTPNLVQVTATVTGTPLTKVFVRFKATSL